MSFGIFVSGCVTGSLYALTALAIVIIYKSSKVANFALGGTASLAVYAAFGASGHHVAYVVLVLIAVAVGVVTGILTELILRLLGNVDHVTAAVATFAIALAAQGIIIWRWGAGNQNIPGAWPISKGWNISGALVSYDDLLDIAIGLVVTVVLYLVVQRSRFGLSIRMASSGPITSRLMGVDVSRVRVWTWGVGGGLGGLAALLVAPRSQVSPSAFLSFMMIALVALVIGGFTNVVGAALGGLLLGLVLNALSYNLTSTLTETYLLVIVALLLFLRPNGIFGVRDAVVTEPVLSTARLSRAAASAGEAFERASGRAGMHRWAARGVPVVVAGVVLVLFPYFSPAALSPYLPQFTAMYIAVLGLNVLIGYSGQLSVGQNGIMAIGAYTGAIFSTDLHVTPLLTIPIALVVGLVTGLLIGLPAVRLGPLFLVLFTLVLSFAVPEMAVYFAKLTGGTNGKVFAFPDPFFDASHQYWLGLGIAAICTAVVFGFRQVAFGRRWVAVRDSVPGAQSVGLSPAVVKLTAFVVASSLAALSGVLTAGFTGFVTPTDFSPYLSITLLVAIVVGGIGTISGSVIGALVLTVVTAYATSFGGVPPDLVLGVVLLVVLVASPAGAAHLVRRALQAVVRLAKGLRSKEEQPAKRMRVVASQGAGKAPGSQLASGEALLEVSQVSAGYAGAKALSDVSIKLASGSVTALVGSNGAGKTTLLRVVSGLLTPFSGTVRFDGRDIIGTSPHRLARAGIAHVPEGRGIFPDLTVRENLMTAIFTQSRRAAVDVQEAYEVFPVLKDLASRRAGLLSGGEQQMLAAGRALLTKPRLLLLDEPTLGLSPVMAQNLISSLEAVRRLGLTVLIVEQNAKLALAFADSAYIMSGGRVVGYGEGDDLLAGDVLANYLGVRA